MDNGGPSVSPDEARKRAENRARRRFPLRKLALAGVYAALLIGGKEALAALPNVEVVTLLCALGVLERAGSAGRAYLYRRLL